MRSQQLELRVSLRQTRRRRVDAGRKGKTNEGEVSREGGRQKGDIALVGWSGQICRATGRRLSEQSSAHHWTNVEHNIKLETFPSDSSNHRSMGGACERGPVSLTVPRVHGKGISGT